MSDVSDDAKRLMEQNLDKNKGPGDTHVVPPAEVQPLDASTPTSGGTSKLPTQDNLPPAGGDYTAKGADGDPVDDTEGSKVNLTDAAPGADESDEDNDDDGSDLDDPTFRSTAGGIGGGAGDSGGNKPPEGPTGGANEGGDDGKPVNELVAAMMLVKDKLAILVPAHEKANQMQDTIGVLLQRLKMYEANPPTDLDLTALKAIVATIAALVDAGHSKIESAHNRPELDAALAYLKG